MKLASLHVYPVKACRGLALDRAPLAAAGLPGDRRWMVVDPDGVFLTQREVPRLATISASADADGLRLTADELALTVPAPAADDRALVSVWGTPVNAVRAAPSANRALSDYLGRPVTLVAMDDRSRRVAAEEWAGPDVPVAFADGFPVLIANTASLVDLNERIASRGGFAVPMERFRPNLVVHGAEPFAEDGWAALRIGDALLRLVKPCTRCVVTTTDQADGARVSKEPLSTLATFRRSADPRATGVLFAWNAVVERPGVLAMGEAVEVIETRTPWPVR